MPDDRCSGVTQLVAARPLVIMDQKEVVVQRFQAVPAEGVLAALTHHLRTSLIPLDVHPALGAALDGCVALFHLESGAGLPGKEVDWHGLWAALARVPAGFASGAEFHVAGFALHKLGGL